MRVDAAEPIEEQHFPNGQIRIAMRGSKTERTFWLETSVEELEQIVDEFYKRVTGYQHSVGKEISRAVRKCLRGI